MADKKPWIGQETFPTIWIWICLILNIVGILALIIMIIAEFIVMVTDFHNYVAQYGYNYPARGYQGAEGCGHVEWTNAPKHVGSAVWMLLYQISIIVLCTLVIASDIAWRASSYHAWGGRWIAAFYTTGLMEGSHNPGLFYYVIANAFLKCFIVILYMNQSFYGMTGNSSHKSPFSDSDSQAPLYAPNDGSTEGYIGYDSNPNHNSNYNSGYNSGYDHNNDPHYGSSWKRTGQGYDPEHPWRIYGMEAFVYYAGWLVLFSILPSIIAFVFLAPWGKPKAEASEEKAEEKK